MNRIPIIIFFLFNKIIFSQDQGLEHYSNQKFDDAKKYYEALILGNGSIPEAHFGKGAASYQLGEFDSARDSFDKSLKSSDKQVKSKAYYNLGNTFYKNNKKDEAIKYYRKALELNPNDKEAKFNYELLKYHPDPPKEDNQDQQDQEQEDQDQQDQEQENQEQENQEQENQEQENQEQENQEQENQEQENQEQDGQEEQMSEDEKSQDLKQAESILDALKQDDQIMQKKQIARSKSKKLAKDW